MARLVYKFPREGYKIGKKVAKESYCTLWKDIAPSRQKLLIILESVSKIEVMIKLSSKGQ
mgnify:CR=1 FL=1